MKKVSIEITDEAHLELLKLQLEKTIENGGKKIPIAQVIADFLHDSLVDKKPAK